MKAMILKMLEEKLGNVEHDLYLAEQAFDGMTETELNMEFGRSGSSHKEILNDYKARVDEVQQCIEWIKNVK